MAEAAEALGITVEAVRGRIKRGKLDAGRTDEGVFVWLPADQSRPAADQSTDQLRIADERSELVEELRNRVRYLERLLEEEREARTEERRRHDTLMAQLMQRIPEIEAPQEPPRGPETTSVPQDRVETPPATRGAQEGSHERPWWRRMFGG